MESSYDLEIDRVIREIKGKKVKKVLLQFPDGLKIHAGDVVDTIKEKTNAVPVIFFGTCFGACDIPTYLAKDFDLVVQWGHNLFVKNSKGWR